MHCLSCTVRWITPPTRGLCVRRAKLEIYDSPQLWPYLTATSCFQLFILCDEVNQRGLSAPQDSLMDFLKRVVDVAPWGLNVFMLTPRLEVTTHSNLGLWISLSHWRAQRSHISSHFKTQEDTWVKAFKQEWFFEFPQCEYVMVGGDFWQLSKIPSHSMMEFKTLCLLYTHITHVLPEFVVRIECDEIKTTCTAK